MKRISARYLLSYTTDQLWEILRGNFVLVFDNNEALQTSARPTIYSSYVWDYHRQYPNTPILPEHHVTHLLKLNSADLRDHKRLATGTHLKLISRTLKSVYHAYQGDSVANLDTLAEMAYRVTNTMYNDLSYRCEPWVTSLDIEDFIDLLDHPTLVEAKKDMQPTDESINAIYKTIGDILLLDPTFADNPISKLARGGLVNMGQVYQSVGPRGVLEDTGGRQFPRPIMRSFIEGLRSFHDSLIESRQAARSLAFSKAPLEQTEYFSRRLQLICQTVRNLHMTDCGSKSYLPWTIRGRVTEGGKVQRRSDLDLLVGKHYIKDDGTLGTIQTTDAHLIGHTLKLRSPLHCAHADAYGICAACFGELSYNIPEGSNIGQMCCTSMTQQSSQNVLSTKHHVGSASVAPIHLDDFHKKFLDTTGDKRTYLLAEELKGQMVRLVIPAANASNFTDIATVKDVNDLNIVRISEMDKIGLTVGEGEYAVTHDLTVAVDRRLASMTYPLLAYIKQYGWSYTEKQNYSIDMSHWDWTRPILELPMKSYNMSDHAAEIAAILEASMKDVEARDRPDAVDPTMADLFDHVNSKLNVNLAVLEVVLYAAMVRNAGEGDYGLPKEGTRRALGVMDNTIENRSMAAKFAYEHQKDSILTPRNYITPNRMDHPFDAIMDPAEVLAGQY